MIEAAVDDPGLLQNYKRPSPGVFGLCVSGGGGGGEGDPSTCEPSTHQERLVQHLLEQLQILVQVVGCGLGMAGFERARSIVSG